jgi:glutamate-5-semialdehyde dehydrogenase
MTNNVIKQIEIAKSTQIKLLDIGNNLNKQILLEVKNLIIDSSQIILEENEKDLAIFEDKKSWMYDRLLLTSERIRQIAEEIEAVANYNFDTDNNIISEIKEYQNKNKINIKKISIPFGVVAVIYESRPNVTVDVFTLCFRSQNAVILKGGKEAKNTNEIFVKIIKNILKKYQLENVIQLLSTNRQDINTVIQARGLVDLCIPRGGRNLIDFVRKNSLVPVIETGAGVVHLYFDKEGCEQKAKRIISNAKTRRVSVCNALDCLLVHKDKISQLHYILSDLAEKNVILFLDEHSFNELNGKYPASLILKANKEQEGMEFLDYKMLVKIVTSFEDALIYISKFTSNHSEGIITENKENASTFAKTIDSSVIYINSSTAFTDGAQFGLGSEIGISTQKMHARGPMGVDALRTIKYIIEGEGAIRL